MEITWKKIERTVYILTILVGVIFYIQDEAKEKATTDLTIVVHTEDIQEIKSKLERNEEYWLEQKEVNGAIITALSLDVD